jgi:hypothetical protein
MQFEIMAFKEAEAIDPRGCLQQKIILAIEWSISPNRLCIFCSQRKTLRHVGVFINKVTPLHRTTQEHTIMHGQTLYT